MGRLAAAPHELVRELLLDPQLEQQAELLPHLLKIDAAHVVMLHGCALLDGARAAALLALNEELGARLAEEGRVLEAEPGHRGLYMLYEGEYVRRLGARTGGAAHLARSRNDINAALARLRARAALVALVDDGLALGASLVAAAGAHVDTTMAAFTHLQPAQPSSLGHYLAGWTAEFTRGLRWLDDCYAAINLSPMGAAAGLGTGLPIDPARVASLLGFDGVIDNSADAVASRDWGVRLLSALASLGVSLTRLATDMQTWSSAAYGFLDWPDELVSTSSIMPQKRNAYVWENVRGQAGVALGSLAGTLAGLKNVPFANSIEGGSEALAPLWPALQSTRTALRLTRLLVRALRVDRERMLSFLERSDATFTALADMLVLRHGLSFRQAHDAVGLFLRTRLPGPDEPARGIRRAVAQAVGAAVELDAEELRRALDARACTAAAVHGGGPAPDSVRAQLTVREQELLGLRRRQEARRAALAAGETRLRAASAALRAPDAGFPAHDLCPPVAREASDRRTSASPEG